ncbi:hypothetical protein ACT7DZ_07720 [Bacillus cereus]
MTLLLQIIVPLICAIYLFTLYHNGTYGSASFIFQAPGLKPPTLVG